MILISELLPSIKLNSLCKIQVVVIFVVKRHYMFPVRYELGFYIPEEGILHGHRRENLKSYIDLQAASTSTNEYVRCRSPLS
jgi:hypothetical protein